MVKGEKFDLEKDLLSKYEAWAPIILCSFLASLFIGLGMALLVVPGVIITLMLSQTMYIIADTPNNKVKDIEALKKSKEMMEGHKSEYFFLLLSFIGWFLLIVITFGLAAIWVVPYVNTTMVMYYAELKKLSN